MIIKNLHGRNFMRYDTLSLSDIPESGLIAILGENESGKSTIGECIAFALFGQTIRTAQAEPDLNDIISWNKNRCDVTLEFAIEPGDTYRVKRLIDREGTRQAELFALPGEEPIAQGIAEVGLKLTELLGIRFDEFRYSFYLAQNELDLIRRGSENDRQRALYNMLGISEIEQAADRSRSLLDEMLVAREQALGELNINERLAASYEGEEERLVKTRDTIGQLDQEMQSRAQQVTQVEGGVRAVRAAIAAREEALHAFYRLRDQVTYAYHRDRASRDYAELNGMQTAMEAARERLKTDYIAADRALIDLRVKIDDARQLKENLERLEELVALHSAAVKDGLKRAGRGPKRQDYLLSESEREKLSVAEARIRRRNARLKRRRIKAVAAGAVGALCVIAALGFHVAIQQRNFSFMSESDPADSRRIASTIGFVGVFFFGLAGWIALRVRTGRRRLGSLLQTRQKLWDKIEILKRSMTAAENFQTHDAARILETVNDIRDEGVRSFYRTLREQHPNFFKDGHRPELESLLAEQQKMATGLEQIKDTAVHYKHVINVLRQRLPIIQKVIGSEPSPSEAQNRQIGDPEQIEARVTELLEQCAVSLSILQTLQTEAVATAPPDDDLATRVVESVNRLASVSPHGGNGHAEELAEFQNKTALPQLVHEWARMDQRQLENSLAAESTLLMRTLPSEKELRAQEEACAASMVSESSTLAATRARKETLAESIEALSPSVQRTATAQADRKQLSLTLEELDAEVDVYTTLVDLLEGTSASMKNRLGPGIAKEIAAVLPRITGGRYEQVEVNDRLEIRLASPEKKGADDPFVQIADLSGGAADQLLISLRLALARAMLHSHGNHETGFLFFDEPVASFDAERAVSLIELLSDYSPTFRQTFIVSHNEEIARGASRWAAAIITTNLKSKKLQFS